MNVLIIKMSSMGDIIHAFPALTDAGNANKNIQFDWVVDQAFQELPRWHPLVNNVIPVALRKWRKQPFAALKPVVFFSALKQLRSKKYNLIIDAQGLLKSNVLSLIAKGPRCGFDKHSARESWLNFIYQKTATVDKDQHAVNRVRSLFAQTLGYALPTTAPDYGLKPIAHKKENYLVFLPNTTWDTKHYPETYWQKLIGLATAHGLKIQIPWGAEHERKRAERLAEKNDSVTVLPRMLITDVAHVIANAKGVIALDTGLAHVAAAYGVPTVSLYGPTNPNLTGAMGLNQKWLAAKFECAPCFKRQCQFPGDKTIDPPCFTSVPPETVWQEFKTLLAS